MKTCIVIPHYNQTDLFIHFLPLLSATDIFCVIVDDGSDDENVQCIEKALSEQTFDFSFTKHEYNRGKGAAVSTGAVIARSLGFTHILQVDADGQHNLQDIEKFLELSRKFPEAIISGHPQFDNTAPKARLYGRKVTDFWVAIETLSLKLKDSLCGFRIYPLNQFEKISDNYYLAKRMEFDTDILVKSVWQNIDVRYIPTSVIYHKNSASHFHYLRDNLQLIMLHTRLMFGMIIRFPALIFRKIMSTSKRA